jgi:hypothetical protein
VKTLARTLTSLALFVPSIKDHAFVLLARVRLW